MADACSSDLMLPLPPSFPSLLGSLCLSGCPGRGVMLVPGFPALVCPCHSLARHMSMRGVGEAGSPELYLSLCSFGENFNLSVPPSPLPNQLPWTVPAALSPGARTCCSWNSRFVHSSSGSSASRWTMM